MVLLLFALYTLLSGAQQGIITWLFREYVPPFRADWVHAALHYGGVIIYLLLVGWAIYLTPHPSLLGVGVLLIEATLARALLFDPALNTLRSWFNYREGRAWGNVFEVGTIAAGDKAVRWLADKLGMEPEHLRFLLWLVCVAAVVAWLLLK
jgi:GNAT superfamily N-acetyltransferase